jgi:hypothetical protein
LRFNIPQVICNALALFWATERTGPNFSANLIVGRPGLSVTHEDGSSKLHAMTPQNPAESFPSFVKGEERGYLGPQYKTTRKNDGSITHSNQGTPGPSLSRLHSMSPSRSSKLPRAMDSVADFFRGSQEQPRDEHQLEVSGVIFCVFPAAKHSDIG